MSPLLSWTLRAAATIALGLLLSLALRRRSAATRNLVLRATLAVALALPVIAAFAPRVEVAAPAVALPATIPITPLARAVSVPTPIVQGWSVEADDPARPASYGLVRRTAFSSSYTSLPILILPLWLGGTGLLVLRWLAGLTRLLLLRRRAIPTDAPDVWRAAVPVPATYAGTVLLPLESDAWPEARRRAAILHERAHVARRDWAWQTLAALFAALHWPNPLAWILVRSLRDTAEAAADDAALAHMAPSDYARELLAVAKSTRPVGPALAMARRGGVRDRVVAVLAAGRDRRRPSVRTGGVWLTLVLAAGIAVAGLDRARADDGTFTSPLPNGAKVEVVSLREFGMDSHRAWTPGGTALPFVETEKATSWRRPAKGMRRVMAEIRVAGLPTDDAPSVAMDPHRTQEEAVLGQPQRGAWVHRFFWEVPTGRDRETVRVAVASGAWKVYDDASLPFSAVRKPVRSTGGSADDAFVSFRVPKPLIGQELRLVAVSRNGSEAHVDFRGFDPNLAHVTEQTVQLRLAHTDPESIRRIRLQYRDYDAVAFPEVALRPLKASSAAFSTQTFNLPIEILGLAEGERSWKSDGTPVPSLRPPTLGMRSHPKWRQLAVALRVPTGGDAPQYVRATAWAKYAYPSQNAVFRGAEGGARIAWCRLEIRPDVKTAKLGVDLEAEPPTVVDAKVGDWPGEATVRKDGLWHSAKGDVRQSYAVTLNGIVPPGRDHLSSLRIYGTDGRCYMDYAGALAFGPGGSYLVSIPMDRTIGRVVLTSYTITHARFDGVHLYPNP